MAARPRNGFNWYGGSYVLVMGLFWPLATFHGHKAVAMEIAWLVIVICATIGIRSFLAERRELRK
jgi:hypothetical protein